MQIEVEAEQFKPDEDKIPNGAVSDGRGDPRKDAKSAYYVRTAGGAVYLKDGDYLVYYPGTIFPSIVSEENFHKLYTSGE